MALDKKHKENQKKFNKQISDLVAKADFVVRKNQLRRLGSFTG